MTDKRMVTAYHEAGHAVVAHVLGFNVVGVDIYRKGNVGGSCWTTGGDSSAKKALVGLAGYAGESLVGRTDIHPDDPDFAVTAGWAPEDSAMAGRLVGRLVLALQPCIAVVADRLRKRGMIRKQTITRHMGRVDREELSAILDDVQAWVDRI